MANGQSNLVELVSLAGEGAIDPAIPFAWRHQMVWQARTIS
jgi:hypothetical protein